MERGSVIDYFREYEKFKPTMIKRELDISVDSKSVITILGPRRAGKTYYLFQLMAKVSSPVYLAFDDYRLNSVKYNEIEDVIRIYSELYGKKPDALFLDEIQEIDRWELTVRMFQNINSYRIFITGSSSKMLSSEIATQLRGRTLSYLLLPFSFREYLSALNFEIKHNPGKEYATKIKRNLSEYLDFGGFPKVVYESDKIGTLREYSDLILLKDFVERHNVKNMALARYLHESILQNFSREISINSMFKRATSSGLKVTKGTVYDYIGKLNDTVFFFFVSRYSKKAHMRASWPKKVYLADTGLAKIAKFSEDIDMLMENAVFLQLMRRKNTNKLADIFYWKDKNKEVDFVVKEASDITELIQVSYEINESNMEREVGSLLSATEELKCKSMCIITWDQDKYLNIKNKRIHLIPLWKWFLE